jgi:uncharacterized protein (TIGR03084 family)
MTAPSASLLAVLTDLAAEGDSLESLVATDGVDLTLPTPAPGWTIAHQLGHLQWTDELTILACRDPDRFRTATSWINSPDGLTEAIETGAAEGASLPADALLAQWRDARAEVLRTLADVPSGTRVSWLGRPMGAGTLASARIMETWAHGEDVADALGVRRAATDRIRHVADLGVRTRDHSFRTHRLPVPDAPFRVELTAPSDARWTWGPQDAEQRVVGPALDFALLVTRRRHPDDLAVRANGALASRWLTIAQAFAGSPGADPPRRSE